MFVSFVDCEFQENRDQVCLLPPVVPGVPGVVECMNE